MSKILVVDDSALMRKKLREILEPKGHEVLIARNGLDALVKARENSPDLITLDINMPELDGLSALAALLAENSKHKVIMFSSLTQQGAQATIEALALGAWDFLPKPGGTISLSLEEVEEALLAMIDSAISARTSDRSGTALDRLAESSRSDRKVRPLVKPQRNLSAQPKAPAGILRGSYCQHAPFDLTVIGVSTGGPRCLENILRELPADYPNPVLVAQHMPAGFTQAFADRLDGVCSLKIKEVSGSEPIEKGCVFIARGGADMAVTRRAGRLIVQSRPAAEGQLWHPSVSVLVSSAMRFVPATQITGVMLTGMGYDGAEEMTELKRAGGTTLAESEKTSVVFGMPKELIERGGACEVLDSDQIAQRLMTLCKTKRRLHGIG